VSIPSCASARFGCKLQRVALGASAAEYLTTRLRGLGLFGLLHTLAVASAAAAAGGFRFFFFFPFSKESHSRFFPFNQSKLNVFSLCYLSAKA
jgi:hypothetical protein